MGNHDVFCHSGDYKYMFIWDIENKTIGLTGGFCLLKTMIFFVEFSRQEAGALLLITSRI